MSTILLSGCAIIKKDMIVLIRKKDKQMWEIPGGFVSSKENIEDAAVKKTYEQIGVNPFVIQQFTLLEYQKDGNNIEAYIFECDVSDGSEFVAGDGVDEVKWFSLSEVSTEMIGDDVTAVLEELGI